MGVDRLARPLRRVREDALFRVQQRSRADDVMRCAWFTLCDVSPGSRPFPQALLHQPLLGKVARKRPSAGTWAGISCVPCQLYLVLLITDRDFKYGVERLWRAEFQSGAAQNDL